MNLPPDLRHALSLRAARDGVRVDHIIAIAVRAHLQKPPKRRILNKPKDGFWKKEKAK